MSKANLIKTQWLYDFLLESKLIKADRLNVYGQDIQPESCVHGADTGYELSYDCIIFITDYARELSSLILVVNDWLAIYQPNWHHQPTIKTDPYSDDLTDVLITIKLTEIHRYIECEPSEAEGTQGEGDDLKYIKLSRSKPDDLMDLESIRYQPFKPRVDW